MGSFSEFFQSGIGAIQAARGFEMTFAGLTITFTALGTIAICISLLPHLLSVLNKYIPEKVVQPKVKQQNGITDEVVAAIGLAYHSLMSSGK
jgi:hypothetical protein